MWQKSRGSDEAGGSHGKRKQQQQQQLVIWAEDQQSFRVEQEGAGLSDHNVRAWLADLQKELRPGSKKGPSCSSLNLSNNEIGDYAVGEIMKFLVKEAIPVQLMKLYKNWISDDGMRAIGDMIKFSPDPVVQEIHLSHNCVTQDGALAILEAVWESNRYPCNRGREGSPLWLRMENNNISWEPVIRKLKEWNFAWFVGDTRDSWKKTESECPVVAMHWSYDYQTPTDSRWENDYWYDDGWYEGDDDDWEWSGGWGYREDMHEDPVGRERQLRRFIDNKLTDSAERQMKKFNLVFSVLDEMKERQANLEGTLQELLQNQRQQQQQLAPAYHMQPFQGDAMQQHWGGEQHFFCNGNGGFN